MTVDQRIPAARLRAELAAAGYAVTWCDNWRAIARCIARQESLPPRPTVYDPAVMRAIYDTDAVLARAAMRAAAGWLQAPHGDDDFEDTLRVWETGACDGAAGGERHWVAATCAAFGRGRGRVDVAHCKVCGLPLYTVGIDWRLRRGRDEIMGWRPVWP